MGHYFTYFWGSRYRPLIETLEEPLKTKSQARWVVVKIMVPFWVPFFFYGTYYLGYPKRGHNFDNYPGNFSNFTNNSASPDATTIPVEVLFLGTGGV